MYMRGHRRRCVPRDGRERDNVCHGWAGGCSPPSRSLNGHRFDKWTLLSPSLSLSLSLSLCLSFFLSRLLLLAMELGEGCRSCLWLAAFEKTYIDVLFLCYLILLFTGGKKRGWQEDKRDFPDLPMIEKLYWMKLYL